MIGAVRRAGIEERQHRAGDVVINYAIGPDSGPPMLLIPGQTMTWESYSKVLPELSRRYRVIAVDVRGHGRSSRTAGAYGFDNFGADMVSLLRDVVGKPAIVSGNSSGGLISVWLAANAPDLVSCVVPEDPPLFSAEWPRLRDDCFVYKMLEQAIDTLGAPGGRDLGRFFDGFEVPVEGNQQVNRLPKALTSVIAWLIRRQERGDRTRPVDLAFMPMPVRMLVKGLSQYDPDFGRAFLDGSALRGFDHAETLSRTRCPMLLLHANWFRHKRFGLVGAMEDSDVARVRSIVPHCEYKRIQGGHTIHLDKPREFISEVAAFADRALAARSSSSPDASKAAA